MDIQIIDRGRGPEIKGTRITIYDVLDYHREGWHHTRIAAWLRISSDEVLAALKYIDEPREEVEADYQRILDRNAKGNQLRKFLPLHGQGNPEAHCLR